MNGTAINATNTATIANSGMISGVLKGIVAGTVDLINSGNIASFGTVIEAGIDAKVNNLTSGIIESGSTGTAVLAANAVNVTNAGSISAGIGIQANGAGGTGSVITNSGTITGTGGTAIKLSAAADTLNLKLGSHIVGNIDMGNNTADVINIDRKSVV